VYWLSIKSEKPFSGIRPEEVVEAGGIEPPSETVLTRSLRACSTIWSRPAACPWTGPPKGMQPVCTMSGRPAVGLPAKSC